MAVWQMRDLLPGLYVVALGWLLARLLRRFGDPLPGRVAAAVTLLIGLFLGPALVGGRILLPLDNLRGAVPFLDRAPTEPHGNPLQGDLLTLVAPLQQEVREAWRDGRWPLWNGAMGTGLPLLADPQSQALQPLVVLGLPFDLAHAAAVVAALRLLVALAFGFLFFRRIGLLEAAALFGAIAYGLGGFLGLWLGWPIANAAAVLPAVLWAIDWTCARGARRDAAALLVVSLALLLGGQPESVLYGIAVALGFAALRWRRVPRERRAAAGRALAAAAALAVGLAAPVIGPTFEWLPRTLRAADRMAPSTAGLPWSERATFRFTPLVAPQAFGNGRYGAPSGAPYWGETNINEDSSGFAGTLTLVLVLAALGPRLRRGHARFAIALTATALFLLAPPGALLHRLAPFGFWKLSASGHHRLLLCVNLGLAWLGACGLDAFARGQVRGRRVLAAGAAVAILAAWGTLAHANPLHPETLSALRLGWLALQAKLLLGGVLLVVAARRVNAARGALVVLLASELILAHAAANPSAPKTAFPPPSPALEFLAAQPRTGRMAALDDALPANLAALWDLDDARLYDPAAPAVYARMVRALGTPDGSHPDRFLGGDHALFDALSVRHLLGAPGRELPGDLVLVYDGPDAWIWERPAAPERAALAGRQTGDEARFAWRARGPQRLQASAVLETSRIVTVSTFQDGNWRLLDGGRPAATLPPLVAARLEPGEHQLELIYRPAIFLRGLALAALATAVALAWFVPPPRRRAAIARPPRIDASFRRKMRP